ncbi:MAG: hypothetical protein II998_09750 [Clostridia bacterium]|nr:hypothetical protein [Clostridia bacterium]
MKELITKKTVVALLCVLIMCIPASSADPGSVDDPLITKSYVDGILLPQIKSYVDSQISSIPAAPGDNEVVQIPVASGSTVYNIVNVSKDQTVIGGKSCQMIMRMGSGVIVATSKGGVCDVTLGADLPNGTSAPSNHLLIIPVDDGRGIKMLSDGILMISGSYSVSQ